MSAQEQVTKLQALLARVNGRRNEPRQAPVHAEPAHAAPVQAKEEAPVLVASPRPAPVEMKAPEAATMPPVSQAVAAHAAEAVSAVTLKTDAAKRAETPEPPSVEVEVEVEEGMAEVDLDGIDEDDMDVESLGDSVADLDAVAGPDAEELPASSRRPIQIQPQLEDLAFGDQAEKKPTHPVPPESGRQVAIPAAADFEGELSGVRSMPDVPAAAGPTSPAPAAAATAPPAAVTAPPAAALAAPEPVVAAVPAELKAQVTRPAVPVVSPAVFRGEAPVFAPATFGELLEATLGL